MQPPTDSTFPPQAAFFHAVLRYLADHPQGDSRQNIHEAIPDVMGLSDAQRREHCKNSSRLRHRHRSGWAFSMLKFAGYVDNPSRGMWCITERGRGLLARNPDGFDKATVSQIVQEKRTNIQGETAPENDDTDSSDMAETETPDERIEVALEEISNTVAHELLERISQSSPAFFEQLVLDLLHAMGYGTNADDLERTGRAGDEGIDGVISLDKLGFERVDVQAKRWQGHVGRPEVQAFVGAIAGRRAKKGVFITTSNFTREAREYGNRMSEQVVLIDGKRLTQLMIEYGVGVTHYRVLRLPRIDGDYFDAE